MKERREQMRDDEVDEMSDGYDPQVDQNDVSPEEGDEEASQPVNYFDKVIVENVTYIPVPGVKRKKYKFLDKSFVFDLPENLKKIRETRPRSQYEDAVETYIYNLISRITKFQVARCQIFLGDFEVKA